MAIKPTPSNLFESLLGTNPYPARLGDFTAEGAKNVKKPKPAAPPRESSADSNRDDSFELVGRELNFHSLLGGNSRKV